MPKLPKQYYQELYSNIISEDHCSEAISNLEAARENVPNYSVPNRAAAIKRYDPGGYHCPRCTKNDYGALDYSLTTEVSKESTAASFTDDDTYLKPLYLEPYSTNVSKSYPPKIKHDPKRESVYESPPKTRTCCKNRNPTLSPKPIAVAYAQDYAYSKPLYSNKGPRSTNVTNNSSNRDSPVKRYDRKEKLNHDECVPYKNYVPEGRNSTLKTEVSQESITVEYSDDDAPAKPCCPKKKTNPSDPKIKSINITRSSSSITLTNTVSNKKISSVGSILKNLNIPKAKKAKIGVSSKAAKAPDYKKPRSVASILKDIQMSGMHQTDSEKSINSVCLDCASTTSVDVRNKCRSDLDNELEEIVKRYTTDSQVSNVFDYGREFSTPKKKQKEPKRSSKTAVRIPKKDDRKRKATKIKPNSVPSVTSMDIADTDKPSSVDMVARRKTEGSSRSRKASLNLPQHQRSSERYPSRYYLNERFGASSSTIDPNLQLLPEPDLLPSKRSRSRPRMPEPDYYSSQDLEIESIYSDTKDDRSRRSSKERVKITVGKPVPMVSSRVITEEEIIEELQSPHRRRSRRDHRSRESRKSSGEHHTRLGVEKPKPFVYSTTIKTEEEMEELESQYFEKPRDDRRRSRSRSREHIDDSNIVYAKSITPEQLEQLQTQYSKEKRKKKPLLTTSFEIIVVEDPNSAVHVPDEDKYERRESQKKSNRKKANFYLPQDGAPEEIIEIRKQAVSVQVDENGTSRERRSCQSVESQAVFSKESQTGETQTKEDEKTKEKKKDRRKRSKERSVLEVAPVEDVIRPLKNPTCSDSCDVVNPCGGVRKIKTKNSPFKIR